MLYWFLPYINLNQPQVYICALPLEPPPSPHSSRLSQSPNWGSLRHIAHSHWLFYIWQYILSMLLSPFSPPSPALPHVHKSALHVCLSIAALQIGSSVSSFWIPYMEYICQYMVFVFLFLTYFTLYNMLQVHPPDKNCLKCIFMAE